MTTVLACDIGATRVKLGLVRQGQVLAQDILASESEQGMAARLPAIAESLRRLAGTQGIRMADCAGLSISVPSLIDRHAHTPWGKVRVVPSALGDAAALVAAQWLVEEHLEKTRP